MQGQFSRVRRRDDVSGSGDLCYRVVHEEQKLVRLDRRFILQNAVLRDADAREAGRQRRSIHPHDCAFQCADDPRNEGARHEDQADAWNDEESGPDEQSPEPAPEGAEFAPFLHPIADVIVAHHVLIGLVILADDGQLCHIHSRPLKFLHRLLSVRMRVKDGGYCVYLRPFRCRHAIIPFMV